MEITLVAYTYGNFGNAPPLEPAQEADTLARYFLDFHRIPGTIVVTTTPFFRLSGFDRRRIDQETEISKKFTINGVRLGQPGSVLIVDDVGKIVYRESITGGDEERVARMIGVVLQRTEGASGKTNR